MLVSPISFMIIRMFRQRIGIFFVLVGSLAVFIAVSSGKTNSESITLLCFGLPLVMLGMTLWFRNREKETAQRFRLLKKAPAKDKDEEQ